MWNSENDKKKKFSFFKKNHDENIQEELVNQPSFNEELKTDELTAQNPSMEDTSLNHLQKDDASEEELVTHRKLSRHMIRKMKEDGFSNEQDWLLHMQEEQKNNDSNVQNEGNAMEEEKSVHDDNQHSLENSNSEDSGELDKPQDQKIMSEDKKESLQPANSNDVQEITSSKQTNDDSQNMQQVNQEQDQQTLNNNSPKQDNILESNEDDKVSGTYFRHHETFQQTADLPDSKNEESDVINESDEKSKTPLDTKVHPTSDELFALDEKNSRFEESNTDTNESDVENKDEKPDDVKQEELNVSPKKQITSDDEQQDSAESAEIDDLKHDDTNNKEVSDSSQYIDTPFNSQVHPTSDELLALNTDENSEHETAYTDDNAYNVDDENNKEGENVEQPSLKELSDEQTLSDNNQPNHEESVEAKNDDQSMANDLEKHDTLNEEVNNSQEYVDTPFDTEVHPTSNELFALDNGNDEASKVSSDEQNTSKLDWPVQNDQNNVDLNKQNNLEDQMPIVDKDEIKTDDHLVEQEIKANKQEKNVQKDPQDDIPMSWWARRKAARRAKKLAKQHMLDNTQSTPKANDQILENKSNVIEQNSSQDVKTSPNNDVTLVQEDASSPDSLNTAKTSVSPVIKTLNPDSKPIDEVVTTSDAQKQDDKNDVVQNPFKNAEESSLQQLDDSNKDVVKEPSQTENDSQNVDNLQAMQKSNNNVQEINAENEIEKTEPTEPVIATSPVIKTINPDSKPIDEVVTTSDVQKQKDVALKLDAQEQKLEEEKEKAVEKEIIEPIDDNKEKEAELKTEQEEKAKQAEIEQNHIKANEEITKLAQKNPITQIDDSDATLENKYASEQDYINQRKQDIVQTKTQPVDIPQKPAPTNTIDEDQTNKPEFIELNNPQNIITNESNDALVNNNLEDSAVPAETFVVDSKQPEQESKSEDKANSTTNVQKVQPVNTQNNVIEPKEQENVVQTNQTDTKDSYDNNIDEVKSTSYEEALNSAIEQEKVNNLFNIINAESSKIINISQPDMVKEFEKYQVDPRRNIYIIEEENALRNFGIVSDDKLDEKVLLKGSVLQVYSGSDNLLLSAPYGTLEENYLNDCVFFLPNKFSVAIKRNIPTTKINIPNFEVEVSHIAFRLAKTPTLVEVKNAQENYVNDLRSYFGDELNTTIQPLESENSDILMSLAVSRELGLVFDDEKVNDLINKLHVSKEGVNEKINLIDIFNLFYGELQKPERATDRRIIKFYKMIRQILMDSCYYADSQLLVLNYSEVLLFLVDYYDLNLESVFDAQDNGNKLLIQTLKNAAQKQQYTIPSHLDLDGQSYYIPNKYTYVSYKNVLFNITEEQKVDDATITHILLNRPLFEDSELSDFADLNLERLALISPFIDFKTYVENKQLRLMNASNNKVSNDKLNEKLDNSHTTSSPQPQEKEPERKEPLLKKNHKEKEEQKIYQTEIKDGVLYLTDKQLDRLYQHSHVTDNGSIYLDTVEAEKYGLNNPNVKAVYINGQIVPLSSSTKEEMEKQLAEESLINAKEKKKKHKKIKIKAKNKKDDKPLENDKQPTLDAKNDKPVVQEPVQVNSISPQKQDEKVEQEKPKQSTDTPKEESTVTKEEEASDILVLNEKQLADLYEKSKDNIKNDKITILKCELRKYFTDNNKIEFINVASNIVAKDDLHDLVLDLSVFDKNQVSETDSKQDNAPKPVENQEKKEEDNTQNIKVDKNGVLYLTSAQYAELYKNSSLVEGEQKLRINKEVAKQLGMLDPRVKQISIDGHIIPIQHQETK